MEAVIVIDVLRRGGVEVTAAGLEPGPLVASRGVRLLPDLPLDEVEDPKGGDALVLPGGLPGTIALREDSRVRDLAREYAVSPGKLLAAICAAPMVLDAHGLLEGKTFTCHPSVADKIQSGTRVSDPVVEDGNLVTSQGPGTAIAFALKLVERLVGESAAKEVAAAGLM